VTIVPDVYWRQEPVLTCLHPGGTAASPGIRGRHGPAAVHRHLRACVDWLSNAPIAPPHRHRRVLLRRQACWLDYRTMRSMPASPITRATRGAPRRAKTIDGPLMMHFGSLDYRVRGALREDSRLACWQPNTCTFWYEARPRVQPRRLSAVSPEAARWHGGGHWISRQHLGGVRKQAR